MSIYEEITALRERIKDLERIEQPARSGGLPVYPTLTSGSVLFAGAGGVIAQDSTNFVWNDTNNTLAVPTLISSVIRPGALLDISNTGAGGDSSIELGSAATGNRYAYIDFHGDDTYTDYCLRIIRANTGANAESSISHRGTGPFSIIAVEAAPIQFYTSSAIRAYLDSSGNFGVGTTSPSALVHAKRTDGSYQYKSESATRTHGWGTSGTDFFLDDVTGAARRLTITTGGAVGISNISPTARLDIIDGSTATDGELGTLRISYSSDNNKKLYMGWDNTKNTNGVGYIQAVQTGTAYRALLLNPQGGNVGISMAAPTKALEIGVDSAGKPTTNTWQIISDARTKRNVTPYKMGFDLIRQIEPVNFEYNGKGGTPEGDSGVGVLAQDIEKFAPQMVRRVKTKVDKDDDERLEYQGNEVQYAMINAMKEAFARIEKLEAKEPKNPKS
jgi:hypothetical protein